MSLYRDTAVVLRVQKLGEADRIITLLTKRGGKVRAVAKGVRRTKSRFGARLEPFAHVDVQLYTGRTLDVITQVQTVDAFGAGLVDDYARYTAGCAVLETADRLTAEENAPSMRLHLLVVGALRALAGRDRDPALVLDAFLLRAMAYAGWAPAITECARCGAPGPHRSFSVPAGGSVCGDCRPPGSANPAPDTLSLLAALLHGDWPVAEAMGPSVRREGSGLVAAHLQWHLERQLRSLPLVERRAPAVAEAAAVLGGVGDVDAIGDVGDLLPRPGTDRSVDDNADPGADRRADRAGHDADTPADVGADPGASGDHAGAS